MYRQREASKKPAGARLTRGDPERGSGLSRDDLSLARVPHRSPSDTYYVHCQCGVKPIRDVSTLKQTVRRQQEKELRGQAATANAGKSLAKVFALLERLQIRLSTAQVPSEVAPPPLNTIILGLNKNIQPRTYDYSLTTRNSRPQLYVKTRGVAHSTPRNCV